jgi:hypothetical protein
VKFFTPFIACLVVAACTSSSSNSSSTPSSAALPDPATAATISGKIVVEGQVPPPEIIRLDGDPKCLALANGQPRRTESVVVGAGNTLQNVFVYVKDGLPQRLYPVPTTPAVLDQQRCWYVPRVLGVQVGQQLTIRNSDPLLHNVHAEGAINQPFDVGTPVAGVEVKRTFATREVMVPVKCNVHAWMHAYIGVVEHPYFAVSDQSGRFSIAQLPPGSYTLEIWHEKLGTQTQQVTVTAKETKDLTFTYKVS